MFFDLCLTYFGNRFRQSTEWVTPMKNTVTGPGLEVEGISLDERGMTTTTATPVTETTIGTIGMSLDQLK